jgi:Transglutaminase-like superfamily
LPGRRHPLNPSLDCIGGNIVPDPRSGPGRAPRLHWSPVRRFDPANLRAAWWAIRTARRTRRVLTARGLDAALSPPPPPPLPVEAERGVRGALRRWHESCLVNSIVLQAWEAAHGRRRELVVGVTGSDRFHAHAWLQGDPVPPADDPETDPSVLPTSGGNGSTEAADVASRRGRDDADRDGPAPFNELLRRPAPHYPGTDRPRIR